MPNLARLVERGVMGNLASLQPCLTPMLWTSIATGRTADEHGVLGFVEPRPDGLGIVPAQSSSRRVKALWNMLGESGLRSCVVAWPVSDPVEQISGVSVSERMTENLAVRHDEIGPAPSGCVYPAHLEPFVSELRIHPCELTPADLAGMIPQVAGIDLGQDLRPAHLAHLLARCASVHAVATAVMEAEPWDFLAVYYDAIDRAGHDFMAYRAPRLPHISERDFELYRNVMDGLYEFHDAMLGRLMELAGEDTTIVLLSDHGFQSGGLRPAAAGHLGTIPAEGADWHRMLGVLAMKGPGIKADERIYGASLLDIAPTVLALFGLPVGRDLPGRVLSGAFVHPPQLRWVDTWETGQAAAAEPVDLADREASIRQLAGLGYISPEAVEGVEAARAAEREARYNLATVHLHHGRPARALPLLESLCEERPMERRYGLAWLSALSRLGRHAEVLREVNRMEAGGGVAAQAHLLAAAACLAVGLEPEASRRLAQAAGLEPENPIVHQVAGDYQLARGRHAEARACYERAIAIDADNASAHCGLAQVHLEAGEFSEAAESALSALQCAFWNPVAQFRLGRAMEGLGRRDEARRAYHHAVEQSQSYPEACLRLSAMYQEDGDFQKGAAYRAQAYRRVP